jgi:hypothetical protein
MSWSLVHNSSELDAKSAYVSGLRNLRRNILKPTFILCDFPKHGYVPNKDQDNKGSVQHETRFEACEYRSSLHRRG